MKIPFEHLVGNLFCELFKNNLCFTFFYDFFIAQMPAKYRKNKIKPRGVSNRNRGLDWVRANASDGVLYFADDDNTYDLDIFEQVSSYGKK